MSQKLSLLREKFIIRETGVHNQPIIALGNRLQIKIHKNYPPITIRCHSMHMTLRFGAEIIRQFTFHERVENAKNAIDWQKIWETLVENFEKEYSPSTWVVVYDGGKPIFKDGGYHMFIDVFEHCDFNNKDGYEQSLIIAQTAFEKLGKSVMIDHDSHVGFILDADENPIRFAIMLRIPGQKSNFVIRLSERESADISPQSYNAMAFAADYIEAINMSVRAGFTERAVLNNNEDPLRDKGLRQISDRLNKLHQSINQFEAKFEARYRPDRPDFELIRETCKGGD